jgi:ribonuclease Y
MLTYFIAFLADAGLIGSGAAGGLVVGAIAAFIIKSRMDIRNEQDGQSKAAKHLADARQSAENLKKQSELDLRDELSTKREEFHKKIDKDRNELKEKGQKLSKQEDNLDRKLDVLATKEKALETADSRIKSRDAESAKMQDELDHALEKQRHQLLKLTNLSEDAARKLLLEQIESEVQHEAGAIVQRELAKAEEESKDNAQKITLQAIQRFAGEHTSATTVSVVQIPSDDMKGRVIGREGRNIRSFENATGVDVIVDDTPGVVVVSCFDPVRRAIASETLRRLIDDGRIHPTRIEEQVEKVTKEIEERIVKYGKDACIEANIQGLHPKLSATMGRLYYRTSYGQNILRHSIEVAYLCQVIADELGLDGTIARRCGFLHDIGKALDHEVEGGHPAIGMDIARKHNEKEAVLNAIGGHHGDIESTTHYTPIVMAADAISGARPGARRETLDRYVKRLEELEGIATSFEGVKEAYAIQAGREVRVLVDAKQVDDQVSAKLARDIANRVEAEMTYPGEVKVTVLREMRSTEYAR